MKKSLIMKTVKFVQNPNYVNHSVHAKPAQSDYVRSTVVGGGAKI